MTPTHLLAHRRRSGAALAGVTVLVLLIFAAYARAGSYTVSGTCGWQAWSNSAAINVYAAADPDHSCPALSMASSSPTAPGAAAGWTFYAPSGTSIVSGAFLAWADAPDGWQAAIYRLGGGASGSSWLNCPGGDGCQANPGNQWVGGAGYNASAAIAHLRCNRSTTCTRSAALQVDGSASVELQDDLLPSLALTGTGASGDWVAGTPPVIIDAADNTGIRDTQLLIDGGQRRAVSHGCDYRYPVPCSNQHTALDAPTTIFADGPHTLTVQAVDAAGNTGAVSRQLLIDNAAPSTPQGVDVAGGVGWGAQETRRVSWTNPQQRFAPITAARYRLCPAEADSSDPGVAAKAKAACVSGQQPGRDVSEIPELELPTPGLWTLRLWLVDAAGNADPDAATVIGGLGYDPTPPEVAGFAEQDPNDPTRVSVRASEDASPLAGGAIEIQRRGARVWRPLSTELGGSGISALVDDERLRKGRYRLRATVTNAAGLQQGTERGTDGQPKTLRLPIRLASRLKAGRRAGRICSRRGAKRRCRWRLRRTVPVALGRRITLRGRLTVHGKPVKRQPLEVWQRASVTGATWQLIGSAQTNRHGRYRYNAAKGVARRLRFRYPGTAHIRGDNATVALRVQAKTTLAVSRRRVINGEYVTFSGRLKGGHRPPTGVLVELQVRSRGKWRTFAQPRADGATGAWKYQYRFETVSGGARFRFRARVRRQAGYPFATGNSRTIGVSVHGL
jgi:hypothetical protein